MTAVVIALATAQTHRDASVHVVTPPQLIPETTTTAANGTQTCVGQGPVPPTVQALDRVTGKSVSLNTQSMCDQMNALATPRGAGYVAVYSVRNGKVFVDYQKVKTTMTAEGSEVDTVTSETVPIQDLPPALRAKAEQADR